MGLTRITDLDGNDVQKGYQSVGHNPNYVLRTKLIDVDEIELTGNTLQSYSVPHGLDVNSIRKIDVWMSKYSPNTTFYPPHLQPFAPILSGQSGYYYSCTFNTSNITLGFNAESAATFNSGVLHAAVTYTDTEVTST